MQMGGDPACGDGNEYWTGGGQAVGGRGAEDLHSGKAVERIGKSGDADLWRMFWKRERKEGWITKETALGRNRPHG